MILNEDEVQRLVSLAQEGDQDAFGQLYDIFSQRIYNFLFGRVRHKETAEDLLHTIFLKAWANLDKYKQRVNVKFSTWLFQIANYTLIDYWRTRKETVELEKIDNLVRFSNSTEFEDYQFLTTALSSLPLDYQTVLELRFKQDLSVAETAKIMKKSEVGIRVLQHRAIKLLRKALDKLKI